MDIILHSEDEPNKVQSRFRADLVLHSFVIKNYSQKQDPSNYADIVIQSTGNETTIFAVDEWQYNEFNSQMDLYNQKRNF